MKYDDLVEDILMKVESQKEYLEFSQVSLKNCQERVTSVTLLNLLINLIAIGQKEGDFSKWVDISEWYFNDLPPSKDLFEYEVIRIEYYKYLLTVIKDKPDVSLAKRYSDLLEDYIPRSYKLNKTNAELYEEVVMSLLESKEFDRAYELIQKIQNIKERKTLTIIVEYQFEKRNTPQDPLIKNFEAILKKRKNEPYHEQYLYFSYYFREMLKINSSKEIFKKMVLGL